MAVVDGTLETPGSEDVGKALTLLKAAGSLKYVAVNGTAEFDEET